MPNQISNNYVTNGNVGWAYHKAIISLLPDREKPPVLNHIDRIEKSTTFFLDQGFDLTGSPWFDHRNVHQWAVTLHKHGKENPHVLGLLYTSWGDTTVNPWRAATVLTLFGIVMVLAAIALGG